jgi:amino-acid N-acetyltransferase
MLIESIHSLAEVTPLLAEGALPTSDISASPLPLFFGVRENGKLVGVVGLELYPPVGLLRSLAVTPNHRGHRLAQALVAHVEAVGISRHVTSLYLLTTTAEPFFAKLGYGPAARATAPEAIRITPQFTGLCPASAAFMVKALRAKGAG